MRTLVLPAILLMGEIAVLDDAPRSATVVVSKDARLFTLDGERFKELIMQAPEITFDIFGVLIRRVRIAEDRERELSVELGIAREAARRGGVALPPSSADA